MTADSYFTTAAEYRYVVDDGKSRNLQVAMEASFISGLSMCNQHTSILYIGVIGLWMFISLIRDQVCFRINHFHFNRYQVIYKTDLIVTLLGIITAGLLTTGEYVVR